MLIYNSLPLYKLKSLNINLFHEISSKFSIPFPQISQSPHPSFMPLSLSILNYLLISYILLSTFANVYAAAAAAKSLQSCPIVCNPIDGSPPGSPVPGILQARTLEWVAISFSNAGKRKVKVKSLSHV